MKKKLAKPSHWISLILWYIPILFVQIFSMDVIAHSMQIWFAALKKPNVLLPISVSAVIWIILYILMTLSIWLVYLYKQAAKSRSKAYVLFWLQLLLSGYWSYLFFHYHQIGLAVVASLIVAVIVFIMVIHIFKLRILAGILLLPYLAWTLYIFCLNFIFWILN